MSTVKRYDIGTFGGMSMEQSIDGAYIRYDDYAEAARYGRQADITIENLERKVAQLAAETYGFKRFFLFAINAAFDGCDVTGDQIQEVAKEIGLVRVEPYSSEKHAEMSDDPSIMEEGDDFYIMNKTPSTDSFLAEVRAQGVDVAIEHLINKFEGTGRIGVPVMALEWLAKELRKGVQS